MFFAPLYPCKEVDMEWGLDTRHLDTRYVDHAMLYASRGGVCCVTSIHPPLGSYTVAPRLLSGTLDYSSTAVFLWSIYCSVFSWLVQAIGGDVICLTRAFTVGLVF